MIQFESKHFGYEQSFTKYYPENLTYEEHLHRSFEIIFVQSGTIDVTIEGILYHADAGSVLFIFPFQTHSFDTTDTSKISILIFSPEYISDFYRTHKHEHFSQPLIQPCIDDFLDLYHHLFVLDTPSALKFSLYKLLYIYETSFSFVPSPEDNDLTIQILNYIEEHFLDSINIQHLSQTIGYSVSFVSKFISKNMYTTFPKLINQARIRHSCFLLNNSTLSITEISDHSGFQNVRTFNRNFFELFQMTPKEYRQLDN